MAAATERAMVVAYYRPPHHQADSPAVIKLRRHNRMVENMLCPEREHRAREYREAVNSFRRAVAVLGARRGAADFEKAYQVSEQGRLAAEKAREALEAHRAIHQC